MSSTVNSVSSAATQRARDRHAVRAVLAVAEQHGELVAAQAGDHCSGASAPRSRAATSLEEAVAVGVPERVVDRLEVVEVDDHQRDGAGVGARVVERTVEPLAQQDPVGEAGEHVVEGAVGVARRLPGADVEREHRQAAERHERHVGLGAGHHDGGEAEHEARGQGLEAQVGTAGSGRRAPRPAARRRCRPARGWRGGRSARRRRSPAGRRRPRPARWRRGRRERRRRPRARGRTGRR